MYARVCGVSVQFRPLITVFCARAAITAKQYYIIFYISHKFETAMKMSLDRLTLLAG